MDRQPAFWNKLADRYARRPVSDEAAYQKKLEITQRYFRRDMRVLEIGCGTGTTAIAHAPYVSHILATDFAPRMIEIARDKAREAGVDNVTFDVSTAEATDAADASFDMVMAHNLLHLLENRERAIANVHRMLRPDGLFVTSTACIGDMASPMRLAVRAGRFLRLFPWVDVFTVAELKHSLDKAGFAIDYEWQPKRNAAVFIICRKR